MAILDKTKRFGPIVACDEYGNHPRENKGGIYIRFDDPVLLAMQGVCEAADNIEAEKTGLSNILDDNKPWKVSGRSMARLIAASDHLRCILLQQPAPEPATTPADAVAADRKRLVDAFEARKGAGPMATAEQDYGYDRALEWVIQQITEDKP